MAGIKIKDFGGIAPSVKAKNLPDNAAVVAESISLRYGDMRPVRTDFEVGTNPLIPVNPLTLYRYQRKADGSFNTDDTSGWAIYLDDVDFATAQMSDEETERTVVTGAGLPKLTDATSASRQLGVPPPASITVTANITDEVTLEERSAYIDTVIDTMTRAINNAHIQTWIGVTSLPSGMAMHTPANGFAQDLPWIAVYTFSGVSDGAGGYKLAEPEKFGWALDPRCNGFWNGAFYCVPIAVKGYHFTLAASASTDLAAIQKYETPTALLTSTQVSEVVNGMTAIFAIDDFTTRKRQEMDVIVRKFMDLMDNSMVDSRVAAVKDFYARSEVVASVDDAKANFADAIWRIAYSISFAQNPGGA